MTGKTRLPVVLLHGLMGTAASHFGHQIERWRADRRLYPVDLPGHGSCRADAPPHYYRDVAGWFARTLERIGPAHLVGASYLGGTIALQAARRRPELVGSVIIAGYTAEVPTPAFTAWSVAFQALADASPRLKDIYLGLHGPRWEATLRTVTDDCRASYDTAIAMRWQDIEETPVPVMLLNGDLKENERAAVARYDGCGHRVRGSLVGGAGHLPMVDRPAAFAAAAEAFWHNLNEAGPA